MNDEIRRSITNQINRSIAKIDKEITVKFQFAINHHHERLNEMQKTINIITDRLIALAVRENNIIDKINEREEFFSRLK
jgi:hypothetical protein